MVTFLKTLQIDWKKPQFSPKKVFLSLGGFDGIHLGHQFLIQQLVKKAREKGHPSALCLFDPLPFQVLRNIKTYKRLLTLSELEPVLANLKLDYFCILPFSKELSEIPAGDFMDSFLMPHFEPEHILVGYDFSFAHQRQGNFSFLKSYQKKSSFSLEQTPAFFQQKQLVSSSLIRKHLKLGEMKEIQKLLGRAFSIESVVLKGKGKARQLGFPTANLKLDYKEYPRLGVYKAVAKLQSPVEKEAEKQKQDYKAVAKLQSSVEKEAEKQKQAYKTVAKLQVPASQTTQSSKDKEAQDRSHFATHLQITQKDKGQERLKNQAFSSFEETYPAVVNIGLRPTFYKRAREIVVEAHILGIDRPLYGQKLRLELLDFIRKELAFKSSSELKQQIKKDIKTVQ